MDPIEVFAVETIRINVTAYLNDGIIFFVTSVQFSGESKYSMSFILISIQELIILLCVNEWFSKRHCMTILLKMCNVKLGFLYLHKFWPILS